MRIVTCEAVLDALDVLCLPALGAFDHVKLYLLTFLQAAEAIGLLLLFVALAKPMAHPTLGMLLKVVVIADLLIGA